MRLELLKTKASTKTKVRRDGFGLGLGFKEEVWNDALANNRFTNWLVLTCMSVPRDLVMLPDSLLHN